MTETASRSPRACSGADFTTRQRSPPVRRLTMYLSSGSARLARARARGRAALPPGPAAPDGRLAVAELQPRPTGEVEAERLAERVGGEVGARGAQRPRRVVDVGAVHAAALVERVEAVALGEEVLEGAGHGRRGRPGRRVRRLEARGRLRALAAVGDRLAIGRDVHARVEVGQAVAAARSLHGERTGGVHAE